MSVLASVLLTLRSSFRSRAALQIEVLALRHQLGVLERSRRHRVRLTRADRLLWAWISQTWTGWRAALVVVKPETVIAWHHQGFRLFWTWNSEVALALLAQIVRLDHPNVTTSDEQNDASLMNAIAVLAELEPATATEALLAAQIVGTQRLERLPASRAIVRTPRRSQFLVSCHHLLRL